MDRYGEARWEGGLKDGKGIISTESKVLNETAYSFHTRFENNPGTNPEELIGAAHAGCFSMAFAAQLEKEGFKAESIQTRATVTLDKVNGGFSISQINLNVEAKIPNISADKFNEISNNAKENCPVSKLMNAKITMDARLV